MGIIMCDRDIDSDELIRRAADGDSKALANLFGQYRTRLKRMVRLRLDSRLQGRLDPSDVLQEAYLDLERELPRYAAEPSVPAFVWLRAVVAQRLMRVHRHHLGTAMRTAAREVSLFQGGIPQASSASLASQLLGKLTSVADAAIRAEMQLQLQEILNQMDDLDREIIALRNFEELTNKEAAEVLGLDPSAASKRYIRALTRLQSSLSRIPDFRDVSGYAEN
jgi:RNA polymerase sigma-70 factor (ECF subfamily)